RIAPELDHLFLFVDDAIAVPALLDDDHVDRVRPDVDRGDAVARHARDYRSVDILRSCRAPRHFTITTTRPTPITSSSFATSPGTTTSASSRCEATTPLRES